MTKCCINTTPLDVPRETLQIRMILISIVPRETLQIRMILISNQWGGGIKNTNKTKVNLTIQNFELNNLTLAFKNAIKRYGYFKNK
jgi:hypothetical protein